MAARLSVGIPALLIGAIAAGAGLSVPNTQAHIGALFILVVLFVGACEFGIWLAERL